MRVLITGSSGFIGNYFAKQLINNGNDVYGIDIKPGQYTNIVDDCRAFFSNSDLNFDLIIHCAAIVGGRETIENEPISVATDLSIDAEMFNWATKTQDAKVVYFSSSAAYPISYQEDYFQRISLSESDLQLKGVSGIGLPDKTYGWAKLTGEVLAQYARDKGLEVFVFRPFSGYGENQDASYPFPAIMKRIYDMNDPVDIWGSGFQVRDFIHISDIYASVMKCIELSFYGPVNLSTGIATSFNDLVDLACEVRGYAPELNHIIEKPEGVGYRVGDPNLLNHIYKPRISLREGIRRYFEYLKNNEEN